MSTALAERPAPAVIVTADQVALIKSTIAKNATDAELQLFFYDCQRRGVHPLDRLIHFTKRGDKYTPITSIDFMRARAHETGDCAGISDPEFVGEPRKPGFAAKVTVKRLVGGMFADFTATARWEEYKPDQNDFMWQRMPHTMLGKCAEALALRKAFPQQLQGLYAKEEMDQAGVDVANDPTPPSPTVNAQTGEVIEAKADGLRVVSVDGSHKGKNARGEWTRYKVTLSDNRTLITFADKLAQIAQRSIDERFAVEVQVNGKDLTDIVLLPNEDIPL